MLFLHSNHIYCHSKNDCKINKIISCRFHILYIHFILKYSHKVRVSDHLSLYIFYIPQLRIRNKIKQFIILKFFSFRIYILHNVSFMLPKMSTSEHKNVHQSQWQSHMQIKSMLFLHPPIKLQINNKIINLMIGLFRKEMPSSPVLVIDCWWLIVICALVSCEFWLLEF